MKSYLQRMGILICLLMLPSVNIAQQSGGDDRQSRPRPTRFERNTPDIGEALRDISGFDLEGNPWKLDSLKGHYSVVVLGCLT